jgi:hypothetical protein
VYPSTTHPGTVRPRTLVVACLVAALLGAGARGALATAPPAPARAAHPGAVGPSTQVNGLPAGFARSRGGAVAAATTYVRDAQRLFDLPDVEQTDALRAIAARASTDAYVVQAHAELAELDGIAARGHGHLTWDVAVLATRTDAYTDQRADISVWRVGILSIDGLTAPLAEWTTVAYELVWERGDWRIWSETQTAGPTPMGHPDDPPSTPDQLQTDLAGFTRYPGPDPF